MRNSPAAAVGEASIATAPDQDLRYVGLATRVISFTIDAALIIVVDIIVGVGAALILSLLHIPHELRTVLAVIGAVAYILGSIAYFVIFWSTTGQTPGARVMQIRVLTANGEVLKPRRALLRVAGVVLAALPLFAGFVRILFDPRRRGFQDRLAGTVVVDDPQLSIAQMSRVKRRAIYEASRRPAGAASPETSLPNDAGTATGGSAAAGTVDVDGSGDFVESSTVTRNETTTPTMISGSSPVPDLMVNSVASTTADSGSRSTAAVAAPIPTPIAGANEKPGR
jgi:uncharacterized RDD family membrane protein YckC